MGLKVLVIGEKPSQVKIISNTLFSHSTTEKVNNRLYLRKGNWDEKELTFIPLAGHITNLDTPKEFGWNKISPIEIVKNSKALIIRKNPIFEKIILKTAKNVDELWLATDPDSEGDNIAFEAYLIAIDANPSLVHSTKRVWNSSLTKQEIFRAFNNLITWETDLALAVQGRRFVDAWVGFAGTREVTEAARKVLRKRGVVLSVGRVQLPTLKLIVDRDRERENFKQQLKYNLLADILDDKRQTILVSVKHDKSPFENNVIVNSILDRIKNVTIGKIDDFNARKTNIPPPRPWNTTDTLAVITKQLKVKTDTAMSFLTMLYEKGYISYPRTDNRRFKDNFPHAPILAKLRLYSKYQQILSLIEDASQVRTNGRKEGVEDHDPIHPTGEIPILDGMITDQHIKTWDLISRYYIGMFLPDLVQARGQVKVIIKDEPFGQKYQQTLNEGWTKAITWKKPRETKVFSFQKGQIVQVRDIRVESYKTTPPPQWSDSELIKRLEKLKIGTKSSRPEIIKKLQMRDYVSRKGIYYQSTETGRSIIQIFEKIWPELVTPSFTRLVEQYMRDVESKEARYEIMIEKLREHYINLHKKLIGQLPELKNLLKKSIESTPEISAPHLVCPSCQKGTLIRRTNSKTGDQFFGCSRYPICHWTTSADKSTIGDFSPQISTKNLVGKCPNCEGNLFLKKIKEYRLIGCSNYPQCQVSYFLPKKGRLTLLKRKCPKCNHRMISLFSPKTENSSPQKSIFCVICK